MSTDYRCPHCKSLIPLGDVNVSADLALCRSCGKTTSFSVLAEASGIPLEAKAERPKGVSVEEGFRGAITITYQRRSPLLIFLIPFTAFWSGMSMWGIYISPYMKGSLDLSQSLFGLPFLIGTLVLLSAIAFLLLGKWRILLDGGQGTVFLGAGPFGWTRYFTYDRDTLVSLKPTSIEVNNVRQKGIRVRTNDRDFVFGAVMKEEAKLYIGAKIQQAVKNL